MLEFPSAPKKAGPSRVIHRMKVFPAQVVILAAD